MLKQYQFLKTLSKQEMTKITGGITWPDYRDFQCRLNNGTLVTGGCTIVTGYAHSCCMNKYGTPNVEWGPYGCPYDICG